MYPSVNDLGGLSLISGPAQEALFHKQLRGKQLRGKQLPHFLTKIFFKD